MALYQSLKLGWNNVLTLEDYFNHESVYKLKTEEVYELINTKTILEIEIKLNEQGINSDNIYFRLLSQVQYFEKEFEKNKDVLAYLYYIIVYYVGLFLHPMSGDEIGINYLNKAISIEDSKEKIENYKVIIKMINEEL